MHLQQYTPLHNSRKRRLSFSSEKICDDTIVTKGHLALDVSSTSSEMYPDSPRSVLSYQDDSDYEEEPVSKVPRYVGTIYEQRLAPLSPVTSLPVPLYVGSGHVKRHDNKLQAKFLEIIDNGNDTALESFLELNGDFVDVNQYGEDGVTPVQRVCQDGGKVAVARVLVKYGADLKLTSRDGWAPLHMASFSGNLQLMMYIRSCPK